MPNRHAGRGRNCVRANRRSEPAEPRWNIRCSRPARRGARRPAVNMPSTCTSSSPGERASIGSHVADQLLARGHAPRAGQSQSAGPSVATAARELNRRVAIDTGDIRDPEAVRRAVDGVDGVIDFAARVGVGQSMSNHLLTSTNTLGTAVLLRAAGGAAGVAPGRRVEHEPVRRRALSHPRRRRRRRRRAIGRGPAPGHLKCTDDNGDALVPLPTPETKTPRLASVYALSKFDQERLAIVTGAACGIPTVALRFFNVYGTRQALSNPCTGVLAIFAARLLNDRPPLLLDGQQRRDFVSVSDVARACVLGIERRRTRSPARRSTSAAADRGPWPTSPACSPARWAATSSRS